MSGVFLTHITILLGIAFFSFMIGRTLRINSYEERLRSMEADKEYWRNIASRQKPLAPTPPDL